MSDEETKKTLDSLIDRVVATQLLSNPVSHDEYQIIEDALIRYREFMNHFENRPKLADAVRDALQDRTKTIVIIPTESGTCVACDLADVFFTQHEDFTAGLWVKGVCVGTVSKAVCHDVLCAMTKDRGYNILHFGASNECPR